MLHADHELVDGAGSRDAVIAGQRRPVRQIDCRDVREHLIRHDLAVIERTPDALHVVAQIRRRHFLLAERGAHLGIGRDLDAIVGQGEAGSGLHEEHEPVGAFGEPRRDIAAGLAADQHHRVGPVELETIERCVHVGRAAQPFEHECADHHVHERDRKLRGRAVEEVVVDGGDGEAVAVPERADVIQGTGAGIVHHVADLRLARAPGRLVELIEPIVLGALVQRPHLRDMRLQRGEARLPARVAVGLDLREIGERRPDMADRGQLVEAAGAVGTETLVREPHAARGIVGIDVGAHDQDQRAGSALGLFLGGRRLGQHLAQSRLAGGIVGLAAAGEVKKQVHERGGRRIAAGRLRAGRCRKQRRAQREPGEVGISHGGNPSRCGTEGIVQPLMQGHPGRGNRADAPPDARSPLGGIGWRPCRRESEASGAAIR